MKRSNPFAKWFASVVGRAALQTGRFQIKWGRKRRADKLEFKPGMRPVGLKHLRSYSARYGAGMTEGALLLQQDDPSMHMYGRRSQRPCPVFPDYNDGHEPDTTATAVG